MEKENERKRGERESMKEMRNEKEEGTKEKKKKGKE